MKVIHLISGGDVGGAKTHVLTLLQGLGKTQTVRLACFLEGPFAADARAMGIDTLVLSGSFRDSLHRLANMISKEHFEIIHCHGAKANLYGSLLKTMVHVPIVTTVHSDYRLDYLGRPFHRLTYGTINTVALRRFDYHIGVSDAVAQMLISRGFDPQTMFSIYNGVEFSGHEPSQPKLAYLRSIGLAADESSIVFGIAARLNPVKDISTLIRAFGEAIKTCPNIRLAIAGDGEEREMLEALAKSCCPDGTCAFAGWVSDTDSFYAALDVNMLTSLSEAFPYAIPEGARQHCATIATRVGGIPYIIEDGVTGLLFEPRDEAKLVAHITRMAEDPDFRRQMSENLYQKASDVLSVDATVSKQIFIYEMILRRAKKSAKLRSGITICGAYGKGNAGDDAILKAILRQLHDIDEDIPITVLSHNPKQTKLKYHVGSVHVFNPFAFLHRMHRSKLYISGGGSLIQNQTSTRSLNYYLLSIHLAKLCGCKVMMYACGIGPVTGESHRKHAAKVLNRYVDAITLREDLSAEELRQMGVTKPSIHVTADPALLLEPARDGVIDAFLQSVGLSPTASYALFVLRPWKNFEEKKQTFADAAIYAHDHCGLTPVFFALEPARDTAACTSVLSALPFEAKLLPTPQDETLIIGMIERMKLVVSVRLHTLIFASSVGTPLVGVSYDPKVTGFMRYIGQKHCLDYDTVTSPALCASMQAALDEAQPYSVEHLRELAEENAFVARELLEDKN